MLPFEDSRPIYFGIIPMRKHDSFAKSKNLATLPDREGPSKQRGYSFTDAFLAGRNKPPARIGFSQAETSCAPDLL